MRSLPTALPSDGRDRGGDHVHPPGNASWKPGRALVVDDVTFLRRSLVALLGADGLVCDEAPDVESALAALERHTYDVVLLDLGLGGRSGFEVLASVRARTELDATPVILVTAQACQPGDVASGLLAGAHDYVTRPFVPAVLRARVASARRARACVLRAEASEREADRRAEDAREELAAHAVVERASRQPMPRREGHLAVNGASLAATSATGDLFYTTRDPLGRSVTILLDAAGHGAAAAAIATIAGSAAREALRVDPDLEATYHAVTATLMAHELPRATVALGLVRIGDGVVEVLNAGLPPIVLIDEGEVRLLESVAPPAGVGFVEVSGRIERFAVHPGFAVAMATDGAVAGSHDAAAMEQLATRFGLDRCALALAQADPAMLATLLREHAARPGGGTEDDATLVVIAHDPVLAEELAW
jgi:DNA-binding response OmpR family regulator